MTIITVDIPTDLNALGAGIELLQEYLEVEADSNNSRTKKNLIASLYKLYANHIILDSDYPLVIKLNMDKESFDDLYVLMLTRNIDKLIDYRLMAAEKLKGLEFINSLLAAIEFNQSSENNKTT